MSWQIEFIIGCSKEIEEAIQKELSEKYDIKSAIKTIYGWDVGKGSATIKDICYIV